MLLALRADQQVVLQLLGFRTGKRLHGISFKRVIGDARHEFHGTLFLREIGWAGPVQASCDNTPGSHLQPVSAVLNAVVCSRVHEPQEALSTGSIALKISSHNCGVAALQNRWDRLRGRLELNLPQRGANMADVPGGASGFPITPTWSAGTAHICLVLLGNSVEPSF